MTALARMNAILIFLGAMPVLALAPQFGSISHELAPFPSKIAPPSQPNSDNTIREAAAAGDILATPAPGDGQTTLTSQGGEQPGEGRDRLPVRRFPPTEALLDTVRFEQLQARLQALGVDYYVLERQSGGKPRYRFHSRIRVNGSSTYVRPFDAQDEDPLVAMELVLRELEQWNARREARSHLR